MTKRYRVVFFDVGHTLVYFEPSAQALFHQAIADVGVETTPAALEAAFEAWRQKAGHDPATATFEPTWQADRRREMAIRVGVLAELGVHDSTVADALVRREEQLFSAPGAMRLFAEVTTVLSHLKAQDYRLAIISNWSWSLRRRCAQVGITPYFEQIIGSGYVGCEKPHPRIFVHAMEAMNIAPTEAIHIGDSYDADIVGAHGVGMDAALIWREQAPAPYTDCPILHSLEDLLPLLAS